MPDEYNWGTTRAFFVAANRSLMIKSHLIFKKVREQLRTGVPFVTTNPEKDSFRNALPNLLMVVGELLAEEDGEEEEEVSLGRLRSAAVTPT